LKFYADVHRSKRNGEGFRITYSTDGITFKHVDSFSEVPAGPGDEAIHGYTTTPTHGRLDRTSEKGSGGLLS
jgi:hypothetical protein